MTTTSRQEVALLLYYVEGWSHRRIGQALGVHHRAVQNLIVRGTRWVVERGAMEGVATLPLCRELLEPPETQSTTRHIGQSLKRQEELADALQLRLEQREAELAMYEQWLDGDSHLPSHCKKNPYDQWEMRYLAEKKGEPLPTSAYCAYKAASHCAARGNGCTLGCSGCKKDE